MALKYMWFDKTDFSTYRRLYLIANKEEIGSHIRRWENSVTLEMCRK
jgi:hypothetical protein